MRNAALVGIALLLYFLPRPPLVWASVQDTLATSDDSGLQLGTYINSIHNSHLRKCLAIRLIEEDESPCGAIRPSTPHVTIRVCKSQSSTSSCKPVTFLKQINVFSCFYYILSGSPEWLTQVLLDGESNEIFRPTETFIFTTDVSNHERLQIYHPIYYFYPYTLFITTNFCKVSNISMFSVSQIQEPIIFEANSSNFNLFKLYEKLDNLQGMQLTVAVELLEPYTYKADRTPVTKKEMKNMNLDEYEGIDMRMLRMIQDILNFTVKAFVPEDRGWGQIVNGSWIGMLGAVDRKEADMALTCIAISNTREQAADFTYPYFLDPVTFVSPTPKLLPQWQTMTLPFSMFTWVLLVISLPAVSLTFWLIARCTVKMDFEGESWSELLRAWVICTQALFNQTAATLPKSNASRIILMTWMLCSMIITSIYSGLLLAFLTSPLREKPILTIPEVVAAEGLKWGHLDYGGLYEELYMKSGREDFVKVWEGTELDANHDVCVGKVIDDRYVCFDYKSIVERYVVNKRYHRKPDVIFATDTFFDQLLAFAFQNHSPIKHKFDKIIMDLRANGFIEKWTRDFLLSKDTSSSEIISADADETRLSVASFQGGFFLLFLGYALGLISFLTEYFCECNTKEKSNEEL